MAKFKSLHADYISRTSRITWAYGHFSWKGSVSLVLLPFFYKSKTSLKQAFRFEVVTYFHAETQ